MIRRISVGDFLTVYFKTVLASGTDNVVLALGFGESENRLASWAFAVDVCFSVSEFVSSQLEESAEFCVLLSSCLDLP